MKNATAIEYLTPDQDIAPRGHGKNGREIIIAAKTLANAALANLKDPFNAAVILTDQDNLSPVFEELEIFNRILINNRNVYFSFDHGYDFEAALAEKLPEAVRERLSRFYTIDTEDLKKRHFPRLQENICSTFNTVAPFLDKTKPFALALQQNPRNWETSWHVHFIEKNEDGNYDPDRPNPHKVGIVRALSEFGTDIAPSGHVRVAGRHGSYNNYDVVKAITSGQGTSVIKGPAVHRSPIVPEERWFYAFFASLAP